MNQDQNQNPYQGQPYPPNDTYGSAIPGSPQHEQGGRGFAIASLVLGILSVLLCCVFGGWLGFPGLAFAIISFVRHEEKYKMAIGGIITSVLGILLFGFIVVCLLLEERGMMRVPEDIWYRFYGQVLMWQHPEWQIDDTVDSDLEEEMDLFAGNEFIVGDESVAYYGVDGSFVSYLDDRDHMDNYIRGTYEAYRGEYARELLVYEYTEYGVTGEGLDSYFAEHADNDFYIAENMTFLIQRADYYIIDGEGHEVEGHEEIYLGFMADGYYDAVCLNSGSHVEFTER